MALKRPKMRTSVFYFFYFFRFFSRNELGMVLVSDFLRGWMTLFFFVILLRRLLMLV